MRAFHSLRAEADLQSMAEDLSCPEGQHSVPSKVLQAEFTARSSTTLRVSKSGSPVRHLQAGKVKDRWPRAGCDPAANSRGCTGLWDL